MNRGMKGKTAQKERKKMLKRKAGPKKAHRQMKR